MQLDADKSYEATAQLGVKTATGDAEGNVISTRAVTFTDEQFAAVQARFTGPMRQVPPMHSALKKDGKALYEYARAGLEVERDARNVTVYELKLTKVDDAGAVDAIRILAKVSKGTYIRTLGEDIGEALGCGAHLISLRRIATGHYDVAQCVTLQAFEGMSEDERLACLQPVESLLPQHVRVALDTDDAGRFLSGLRRRGEWKDNERVAVFGVEPKALLGTGRILAGELIPGRLLSPPEIQQILETTT